ncbi:F-box/LRR-repeat protein 4 [Tripterygium wilfordii]|uniref:F-box/LRR-repeat protein 4 n=1 Tax=Tripterygium wilfordii TaxID=458696 RepID=A0A7J7DQ37_TRIWF|nr:uncharacterized protein LOC119997958 [Tripterygium wilfordii]KAF5748427.1 F-box/LRR-repeat protein 4 [Tripterygium wilfordii]
MTILRSRKIPPTIEPATPTRPNEPSTVHQSPPELDSDALPVRRSLRLHSKSVSNQSPGPSTTRGSRNRRRGKQVRVTEEKEGTGEQIAGSSGEVRVADKGKRKIPEGEVQSSFLSLRSGKRVAKRSVGSDGENQGEGEGIDFSLEGRDCEKVLGRLEVSEADRVLSEDNEGTVMDARLEATQSARKSGAVNSRRRYSKKEKGKRKLDDIASLPKDDDDDNGSVKLGLESKDMVSVDIGGLRDVNQVSERGLGGLECKDVSSIDIGGSNDGRQVGETDVEVYQSRTEQFRNVARRNASRFAYFDPQNEDVSLPPAQVEREVPAVEMEMETEDWPGPFSTAMKIIRDRAEKMNVQQGNSSSNNKKSVPVIWNPKNRQRSCKKVVVPSLKELSLKILVKNADAITSLDCVPDALRHKISQMLCDSRKMNCHFLDLLVRGSPMEIRLRDCSWLTEEEFTRCFEACDMSSLTVLQLDQCGRCLPDYILHATLARSSKNLPALTRLSISGACRLSDVGLGVIVSSAPALRSINLNQCSLLTSTSIDTLANSLGSTICELYINDCLSIDAMLILPGLKKLQHLEVLSVGGIHTVCDDFVREYVIACGHNLKELVLADCTKLTDSSVLAIAENCSKLRALDLVNLCKLSDSTMGYLASGCQQIQTLVLCRNGFSDEAVAAFLETAGEHLEELSLNSVRKVGHNTALSLARCSRKLQNLDLSFCRNFTSEAVGLIVDSCLSLRVLKLFGCTQITNVFLDGHSNPDVEIIGLKMSSVLDHVKVPDPEEGPLHYSSVLCAL